MSLCQKITIIGAATTFIASLVFGYLNTASVQGLFKSDNGFVDNKYFQQVSPAGTAFGIVWPIIYLWNLVSIIYIVISIWLPANKSPVNTKPTIISYGFLIGYMLAFGSTVGWLFAFDNEILGLSLAILFLATFSAYFTIGTSYKLVYDNFVSLENENKVMLWLVRGFIQNGLCVFATWLTIATFINLLDVIIYQDSFGLPVAVLREGISMKDASTVILSLLLVFIIVWFILENFVWEKYCRYTFTIYPVFILGFSGLVAKLRFAEDANRNLVFASVILGICVVAFLLRLILTFFRISKGHQTVV